jgi:hypothetical protein
VPVTFFIDAAALMMAYRWPGNVRELRNVVETTVALAESGLIEAADLPDEVRTVTPGSDRTNDKQPPPVAGDLREAERQTILAKVRDCDGNLTQAARRLGIARSTLYLRLARPHRKTPMRLDRIYTRSGDGRRTSLGDGAPFLRSRFRSEAFIQCRGRALRRDAETAPRAAKRRPGLRSIGAPFSLRPH